MRESSAQELKSKKAAFLLRLSTGLVRPKKVDDRFDMYSKSAQNVYTCYVHPS